MRKPFASAAFAVTMMLGSAAATVPARADNKQGFDAWYRGDTRRAIEEWRKAANAGDADAQFNLGQAYTLGRGVPFDIGLAQGWFRKAALQGHEQAQAKYGLVLFDQGKRTEAAPWLDKAVKRGEPRAELVLGTMLFNGDGVAKDWPRAYALIVRAASADVTGASEVQAQMDGFIPKEQRQQGLVLARQYEAEAQHPQVPPEMAGGGSVAAIRGTDLPPSRYDPSVGKPEIIALNSPRGTRAKPVRSSLDRPMPGAAGPPQTARLPRPIVSNQPVSVTTSTGGWRVQLGAFGNPDNARKLWTQVAGHFPGRQPIYLKTGALTRVMVGDFASSGEAAHACGTLRPCVPIQP